MSQIYTRDFQISFLIHMLLNQAFFKELVGYLQLTDFDLNACQLLFETARDYHERYKKLPDFHTLQLHTQFKLNNGDGNTLTILDPVEVPALAAILDMIARTDRAKLNTPYYRDQLRNYLLSVRTSRNMEQYAGRLAQGQAAEEFVQEIIAINESASKAGGVGTDDIDFMDSNPEPMMSHSDIKRVSTGLPVLDKYMSGGLPLKQCGMITACPGVGKTTTEINFMMGAVYSGWRSLFITCELSPDRIKHRYHSILAGIPASYFKKPVESWPADMRQRYAWVLNPANEMHDYAAVVDRSTQAPSVADIDLVVKRWKDTCYERTGTAAYCGAVFIDYLDKVSPVGLRISNNMREDSVLLKISEALAECMRRNDVAGWWATQATRDAVGEDVLNMKQTAFGFHKNDPLDISLGLGVITPDGKHPQGIAISGEDTVAECNRRLMFTFMKNRDNPEGIHRPVYQGKTLRYWNSEDDENAVEKFLRAENMAGAAGHVRGLMRA